MGLKIAVKKKTPLNPDGPSGQLKPMPIHNGNPIHPPQRPAFETHSADERKDVTRDLRLPQPHVETRPAALDREGAGRSQLEVKRDEIHILAHTNPGGVAHGHTPEIRREPVAPQLAICAAPVDRHHAPGEIRGVDAGTRLLQEIHRRQKDGKVGR